jgi:tetratricopeptide (TPR) repeat protein
MDGSSLERQVKAQGQRVALPPSMFQKAAPLIPYAVGAAVATAAASGVAFAVGRSRNKNDSSEDLAYRVHYADLAAEIDDLATCADWIAAALAVKPDDMELRLWAINVHQALGEYENAIAAGEAAVACSTRRDGRADYQLAVVHVALGGKPAYDEARVHLERALQREPHLAGTISRDRDLRPLHGKDFSAMLEEAFVRAGAEHPAVSA